jgi:glycolate oxidase FAD binding subunit
VICPEPSELQELVRQLHRQGSPWLPAGSGSRLHWGPAVLPAPGDEQPLCISTVRHNRLLEHCRGDFTVTVQAGLPLQDLQTALAEAGQWLAIDWPWGSGPVGEHSGTVGGLVARGLSGGLRQRYLGVRDQLIGIGLLRADGTPAKAGGKVVKNVAGFDLMRLFTGSWGSLGLISELTLRTFPRQPQREGLLLRGPLPALEQLRRHCLAAALMPQRLDWWSTALAGTEQPALLLALTSVSAAAISDQLQRHGQVARELGIASEPLDRDALASLECRGRAGLQGPAATGGWLLQLGVLPSHCAELLADPALSGLQACLAAGAGQGLAWGAAAAIPSYRVAALRQRCEALGGWLNVLEQPPGPTGLPAWGDSPARGVIEAIKREFDPLQQLARGRLPGVAPTLPEPLQRS